jgi:hypothetical protein
MIDLREVEFILRPQVTRDRNWRSFMYYMVGTRLDLVTIIGVIV